ncbi:MAG: 50S ribosomal protein L10 [Candidatus Micrarchaeota archaeon]
MPSKQDKIEFVKKLAQELKTAKVIAVASNASLPAKQFNLVKKKTRDNVKIVLARHTLLKRALEEGKPEAKELLQFFGNGSVLILSDLPAFRLFAKLKKNRSKAFAKPGQIAPSEITVQAGETSLPPGPVLTELKNVGIQAKIQGPKVSIMKDVVVAKKGDAISPELAGVLAKLGIEPVEVGITVQAVWDNGTVYKGVDLDVDDEAYFNKFVEAFQNALNLAVSAEIYNATSTEVIVSKAAREANAIQKLVDGKSGAKDEAKPAAAAEAPVEEKNETDVKANAEGAGEVSQNA